jgi:hypothetical protein
MKPEFQFPTDYSRLLATCQLSPACKGGKSHEHKILEFLLAFLDLDALFAKFISVQRKQNQESWYDVIALDVGFVPRIRRLWGG